MEGEGLFSNVGDGVEKERDRAVLGKGGDGFKVDFDAGFAVRGGEDDGAGVGADGVCDLGGERGTPESDGKVGNCEAESFEILQGLIDGGVFDGGSDDVPFGSEAAEEEIETLGSARGENDFFRSGLEERGGLFAGIGEEIAGLLAKPMDARGIRWRPSQVQEHRLENPGVEGGRRVVVQVNSLHCPSLIES